MTGYSETGQLVASRAAGCVTSPVLRYPRDLGMLSAAASRGMIYQWNMDEGYLALDSFVSSNNAYIKVSGGDSGVGGDRSQDVMG